MRIKKLMWWIIEVNKRHKIVITIIKKCDELPTLYFISSMQFLMTILSLPIYTLSPSSPSFW